MSKILSERINEAILESGVGIQAVAVACGISYQAVDKWIKGDSKTLKAPHLLKLAKITGFEAEWLMFGTGAKKQAIAPELKNILQDPAAAHILYAYNAMDEKTRNTAIRVIDTLAEPEKLTGTK